MKDAERTLLVIPGVTEAQVFAKVLVRCEFPMADETIIALQEAQDWIEHETGWKVEMTLSAGKRPEPTPPTDNEQRPYDWRVSTKTMDALDVLLASEKMLDSSTDSASSPTHGKSSADWEAERGNIILGWAEAAKGGQ